MLSLLVPLLASGCGSSPAGPNPAAAPVDAPARPALSFGLQLVPDSVTGIGWSPPTAVTLRSATFTPPAVLEKAVFRMVDEFGNTLAESSIAAGGPLPPNGYMDATAIAQTLTWPAERGFAKRLDLILTVRNALGESSTVTASIEAK
jgi:hypothetical protein